MKSKIEVRKFAVEVASMVLGRGTADKDVVAKAKEIEVYIIGAAELPETYDENNALKATFAPMLNALTKIKN